MLDRREFVRTHPDVHTGMNVFSTTGERIGIIEQIGDDSITIEKGRIFHKDVSVPYDDIEDVREEDVIIRTGGKGGAEVWEEREEWLEEPMETREYTGPEAEVRIPETGHEMETGRYGREEEQTRIPLREEELEAQKYEKEGEIRIPVKEEEVEATKRPVVKEEIRASKDIRTEEQEVGGKVRKENVTIDRSKATPKK
jgi:stress response protein YsnF